MTVRTGQDFVVDPAVPGSCALEPIVDGDVPEVLRRSAFAVQDALEWDKYTGPPRTDGCDTIRPRFHARLVEAVGRMEVQVRILLVPAGGAIEPWHGDEFIATQETVRRLASGWTERIREVWSGKHALVTTDPGCARRRFSVSVNVVWLFTDPLGDADLTVRVHSGGGLFDRADSDDLFMTTDAETAAHEFGHWIGLLDEYREVDSGFFQWMNSDIRDAAVDLGIVEDECPGRRVSESPNIMNGRGSEVEPGHYVPFAEWLSGATCCSFEVEGGHARVGGGGVDSSRAIAVTAVLAAPALVAQVYILDAWLD